jgi:hypothetical protein
MRILAASLAFLGLSLGQQTINEPANGFVERSVTEIAGHEFQNAPIGVWSGGAFLLVENAHSTAPLIREFDNTGREISQFELNIPGAHRINVYSGGFARGFDGTLAIVGSAFTNDGRGAAFLASVSVDRKRQDVIRTAPYAPRVVTIGADGTLWTAGNEIEDGQLLKGDYKIVRRFDRNGRMIGAHVPRSSLSLERGYPTPIEYSHIVSSKDGRIGWFSEATRRYMEFALDGTLIRDIDTSELHGTGDLRRMIDGVALCDGGNLFVSATWLEPKDVKKWGIFVRDRHKDAWSLGLGKGPWGMLYGCDGQLLAGRTGPRSITWLDHSWK